MPNVVEIQSDPFDGLPERFFGVILADPPWRFRTYSAKGRGRCPDGDVGAVLFAACVAPTWHESATRELAMNAIRVITHQATPSRRPDRERPQLDHQKNRGERCRPETTPPHQSPSFSVENFLTRSSSCSTCENSDDAIW